MYRSVNHRSGKLNVSTKLNTDPDRHNFRKLVSDPDPHQSGKLDPNPHQSGKQDPDTHQSKKQDPMDPDKHQSEKMKALDDHFGILEGPNLGKSE